MTYYHLPTATEYDDTSTFARKLTRCGEPWKLDLTQYDSVPVERAALSEGQKYGTPILEPTRYYYPAVDKTAEELAAELEANIDRLDSSVRAHLDRHAHWTAGNMVSKKAQEGKGKAVAVYVWAETVWGLYYATVDALRAGTVQWSEDLLTQWPACPHTMREVRDE